MKNDNQLNNPSIFIKINCKPLTQSMVRAEEQQKEGQKLQKLSLGLRSCYYLKKQIELSEFGYFFKWPVNPYALGLSDYWHVIRRPMDLKTITHKLLANHYSSVQEFHQDMTLMFQNALKYNQVDRQLIDKINNLYEEYQSKYQCLANELQQEDLIGTSPSMKQKDSRSNTRSIVHNKNQAAYLSYFTTEKRIQLAQEICRMTEKDRGKLVDQFCNKFGSSQGRDGVFLLQNMSGYELFELVRIMKSLKSQYYQIGGFIRAHNQVSKSSEKLVNQDEQSSFEIENES